MFVQRYPEAKIVATTKAIDMIANFFESVDLSGRTVAVGDNDTLCLGKHTSTSSQHLWFTGPR